MHELGAKSHVLKPKMWLGPTQVNYTVVPGARSLQGSSWQLAWKLERRHFYCNCNRPVQRTCCNGEDANEFGSETGISDLSQNMPHEKREPVRKSACWALHGWLGKHPPLRRPEKAGPKGTSVYSWGPVRVALCKHPSSMRGMHFLGETCLLGLFRVRQHSRVSAS